MPAELRELSRADVDSAADVLGRAFDGDPLMSALFSNADVSAEVARRELFRFSCHVRFELGWPLWGVVDDNRVSAVACVSYPEFPGWTENLDQIYTELKRTIGDAAVSRLERYSELIDENRPSQAHHFLAVLGVDPLDQGRGFGRMLLEEIQSQAAAHPGSIGVALDTENPRNLKFYTHFGYQLTAESMLGETKIYHFFRPTVRDEGS